MPDVRSVLMCCTLSVETLELERAGLTRMMDDLYCKSSSIVRARACVCMYVCLYVCMYVCVCVCVCVYIYIYIYIYICMYVYICKLWHIKKSSC